MRRKRPWVKFYWVQLWPCDEVKSITSSHGKILWAAALKPHYIGNYAHWELVKAHQIEPKWAPCRYKANAKIDPWSTCLVYVLNLTKILCITANIAILLYSFWNGIFKSNFVIQIVLKIFQLWSFSICIVIKAKYFGEFLLKGRADI